MAKALIHRNVISLAMTLVLLVAAGSAQNVLNSLRVQELDAQSASLGGLTSNHLPFSLGAKAFRAADSATRAHLVKGALAWFKAYTESAAFKVEYAKQRESAKPQPVKPRGTVDSELAKQKAERDKGLLEMKKNLANMSPDMRRQMEATIKQMEQMYAQQDANPQMAAMMHQGVEMERAEEEKSYQRRVAEYEKKWPADPRKLIAQRLQEFLDLSKDVDFNAQLKPEYRKMKFVNPDYESRPDNWKLCYRAGKPAIDAARAFAAAWLKELQAK